MKLTGIIKYIIIVLLVSYSTHTMGNMKIDSLKFELIRMDIDTNKVIALMNIAKYYYENDYQQSIMYSHEALNLSEKLDYCVGIIESNYHLTKIYRTSNVDLAQEFLTNAFNAAKNTNNSLWMGNLYNIFGVIKQILNEDIKAIEYLNKGLDYYKECNYTIGIAAAYHNIGFSYYAIEEYQKALEYTFKAEEINEKTSHNYFLAKNNTQIGDIYLSLDSLKLALKHYNIAGDIINVNNFESIKSNYFIKKANWQLKIHQYDSALIYAQKAFNNARQFSSWQIQEQAVSIMHDAYYSLDNLEEAYLKTKELLAFKDTIFKYKQADKINKLELQIEYEKQKEFRELEYKNVLLKRNIIIAGLILIVIITGILINMLRLKNRKKQLENENIEKEKEHLNDMLELKNRELAVNVINIGNKNELIHKVIQRLSSSELSFKKDNLPHIRSILSELRMHTNQKVWESFESEFIKVHPMFFKNLLNDIPGLTQKERRLCAFLRLNMSTKEISEILHIEVRSIEMARTRLRKKLGLTGSDVNFTSFFSKY